MKSAKGEKLYGAGVFYSDAVDIALPEAYTQAIGQSGLDVVPVWPAALPP